jgi:hypothetical protein
VLRRFPFSVIHTSGSRARTSDDDFSRKAPDSSRGSSMLNRSQSVTGRQKRRQCPAHPRSSALRKRSSS